MQRMNRLLDRAERAIAPAAGRGVAPGVLAILHEVKSALERYAASREPTVIDLHWLAALPAQLEQLRFALGDGEVRAAVLTQGVTEVRQTGIRCVWWVSRRDYQNGGSGELLEITQVPALLRGDPHPVEDAIADLGARLAALEGRAYNGFEHSTLTGEQS